VDFVWLELSHTENRGHTWLSEEEARQNDKAAMHIRCSTRENIEAVQELVLS